MKIFSLELNTNNYYNQMQFLHTNKAKKLSYILSTQWRLLYIFFLFIICVGYDLLALLHLILSYDSSLATFTESILIYIASEQMDRVQI